LITGDHVVTASAIVRELGILLTDRAITGSELAVMSKEELLARVREVSVAAYIGCAMGSVYLSFSSV
jgi:magnesium-transporting ATPase (P-type)